MSPFDLPLVNGEELPMGTLVMLSGGDLARLRTWDRQFVYVSLWNSEERSWGYAAVEHDRVIRRATAEDVEHVGATVPDL